ncbi:uncharacterized protein [Rutidosis leptorrhynchoides]|uniref:uncharacterized protein n=1 Tax=Rutidosis leptorrhynchoides TaxID=125765 RepID=UPI003A9A537D
MPFGLKNAGATYQRLIDMVFKDQIGLNVEAYVDDIVIKSHTEEKILRDIQETFASLRKINMKLNPKKCTFGVEEGKFLGHIVTERDQPLKQILRRPESSGRLAKWAIELGEYEINFAPRNTVKGQILADFLLETNEKVEYDNNKAPQQHVWEFHTDGASSEEGTEYEALLSGLRIAVEMGITNLRAYVDSQTVAQQVNGTFDARDTSMRQYVKLRVLVKELREKSIHEKAIMAIVENVKETWMTPYLRYIHDGGLPIDKTEARRIKVTAPMYEVVNANWQVEVINKEIVAGIKARLGLSQTGWVDELPNVLWAHRTTLKWSTGETPFSLVYGIEAVIPAEICIPTQRIMAFDIEANSEALRENLNLLEERRLMATIRQADHKHKMAKYYNKKVKHTQFEVGDLVLRDNEASKQIKFGKLAPKWEGPYKVTKVNQNGSYMLAVPSGEQ